MTGAGVGVGVDTGVGSEDVDDSTDVSGAGLDSLASRLLRICQMLDSPSTTAWPLSLCPLPTVGPP